MSEELGKFAEKIGVYIAPGGQASIGTQIIQGQKQLRPTKRIPRGSVHFVGRERELTLLHGDLQRGDYVALGGMGGVGKTELATQYARRYEGEYGGIVWLNARETNLAGEVLKFFSLDLDLEIPTKDQQEKLLTLKQQVAWCWSQYPDSDLPILIVFDDVADLANLREAVPDDNRFRVLITTRLRNVDPNFIQTIPLDVLSPKKEPGKALELLEDLLGKEDIRVEKEPETAELICELLEYLPLGIKLVGSYLVKDPEISLSVMLQRLQEQKLVEVALQDRETLNSTQLGVQAAFALSWEKLEPPTQQLGKFLSLFSPQSILWDLVLWVAIGDKEEETDPEGEKQQEKKQLIWSEQELNEARKELYERNLLQKVEKTSGYYKIHSLVRWFLQAQLTESSEKSVLERTFAIAIVKKSRIIAELQNFELPNFEDIQLFEDIIPHLQELAKHLITEVREKRNIPTSVLAEEVIWIFLGITGFYIVKGLYQLAESFLEEWRQVCKILFAGDHPHVAVSLKNLADLYSAQGRYTEAESLYIQALEIRKRLFVGDHPSVASSLNDLGTLYMSQERYTEAEKFHIQALEMAKQLFPGGHLSVVSSLNNVAFLYWSQGWYLTAEELYLQALEMAKRLFPGDNLYVANSFNNLATLYSVQGRYKKAESLCFQALEMKKRIFIGDHLNVVTSLHNLALIYSHQRRYKEAEPLYIQALEMTKRLFPEDHPNLASNLNDLAFLYQKQGCDKEAEPLYIQALEMSKRFLGVNHPNTLMIQENLKQLRLRRTPFILWMHRLGCFISALLMIAILPFYLLWLFAKGIFTFTSRQLRR